jgi:hypothetical protein
MASAETHNKLARDFVTMAGTKTNNQDELLVVVESAILASMHLMVRMYGVKPAHASVLMEACLQNATERFSEAQHG